MRKIFHLPIVNQLAAPYVHQMSPKTLRKTVTYITCTTNTKYSIFNTLAHAIKIPVISKYVNTE